LRLFYFFIVTPAGISPWRMSVRLCDFDAALALAASDLLSVEELLLRMGYDPSRCGLMVSSCNGAAHKTVRIGQMDHSTLEAANQPAAA